MGTKRKYIKVDEGDLSRGKILLVEFRIPSLELLNHILENKDKIQRLNETLEKCLVDANAGEAEEDSYIL